MNIGISTVAFENVEEVIEFNETYSILMEYGVNLSESDVEKLHFSNVKAISVHVPSPNDGFFPNFASNNKDVLKKSIEILVKSIETLRKVYKPDKKRKGVVVLHPGYALDELVPSLYSKRKSFLNMKGSECKRYLIEKEGMINGKEYISSPDYRKHFEIFMSNLPKIIELVENEGFILTIENLNPRLFYILQTPNEMEELSKNVKNVCFCLDVSHLWVSSKAVGFDYFDGLDKIMITGKVMHLHLSNNPSRMGYYEDPHLDMDEGEMNMKEILERIFKYDCNLNIVLEVKKNPIKNVRILIETINSLKNKRG